MATRPGPLFRTTCRNEKPSCLAVRAFWVFERGEPLLPNGICQVLKRLAKRAKIEDMHPHRFRHSYAINALRAGMPEQVLKIIGGWNKIPDTYFRTLGKRMPGSFTGLSAPGTGWGRGSPREGHGGRSRGVGGFREPLNRYWDEAY